MKATVDIIVYTKDSILLIERMYEPYKNFLAFPGGHIDQDEDAQDAAIRELEEETGLIAKANDLELITVSSAKDRDPRGHYLTVVYAIDYNKCFSSVKAGSDAKNAKFYEIEDVIEFALAFDHNNFLKKFLLKVNHIMNVDNTIYFQQTLVGEDIKNALLEEGKIPESGIEKFIKENDEEIKECLDKTIYGLQEDWSVYFHAELQDYIKENKE